MSLHGYNTRSTVRSQSASRAMAVASAGRRAAMSTPRTLFSEAELKESGDSGRVDVPVAGSAGVNDRVDRLVSDRVGVSAVRFAGVDDRVGF